MGDPGDTASPNSMLAAAVVGINKPLQILEIPIPSPAADQILVKVIATSLCDADLAGWKGQGPADTAYCAGHEPVGVVESVGASVKGFSKGDTVGFMPTFSSCQACSECSSGNQRFCPSKTTIGSQAPCGGLSQYCLADPASTVKIPPKMELEAAAPFMCAGVTAYAALKKISKYTTGGQAINVIGCGGIGYLAIKFACGMGYRVHAWDVEESAIELAKGSGAKRVSNPRTTPESEIVKRSGTIVAAGNQEAYDLAFKATDTHGPIIAIGQPPENISIDMSKLIERDFKLIATNQGSKQELEEAFYLAAHYGIKPAYKTKQLHQVNEGFEQMENGEVLGRLVYNME